MTDTTTPGAMIRAARQRAGLTQAQLGERLGITQTAVSYKEAGSRDVTVTDLLAVAAALRVDPAALLPPARPAECDLIDAFLDLLGACMRTGSAEASYLRMREIAGDFARESSAAALRELATERDRAERAEAALTAIRGGVSPDTVFYAEPAASDLAQERVERAERVTTGAQPVAEGDGKPAGSAEAQRGSQPRRGWDQ